MTTPPGSDPVDLGEQTDGPTTPSSGTGPLFLARNSYRRRRLMDAARLLPVLGLVMIMMPVLWVSGTSGGAGSTARGAVYLFTIWALLIVLAAMLARRLSGPLGPEDSAGSEDDAP